MNYEHKNEDSSFSLAFSLRGKEGSVLNYVILVGLGAPPGLAGKNRQRGADHQGSRENLLD